MVAGKTTAYSALSYNEMRTKLYDLADKYPEVMTVETSEERFGIGYSTKCGQDLCKLDIVTVTA